MSVIASNLREIAHDATTPQRLLPAMSAGFVLGLLLIFVELSLASLIFSGPMAQFASAGSGLALFGTFIMVLALACLSSQTCSVSVPEDAPAAIMATVSSGIAAAVLGVCADPRAAFVTVGAAMAFSTLATAGFFVLLGRYRLGDLVRYMPYPVVGGFLAGVGWMLISGGFSIMVGVPLGFSTLGALLTPELISGWAPGLVLAVVLLVALERWQSAYTLPVVLLLGMACFWGSLWFSGMGMEEATRRGLLLAGMNQTALWPAFTVSDLSLIQWGALLDQLPQLLTIPLVSAISFFLISSGLEAAVRTDIDLKHELYTNAFANLVGGLGGSFSGYTALSFSIFGPTIGSNSRLVGLTAALLIGATTFVGANLLGYLPKFVLGGLVLFIGIATCKGWIVEARRRVTAVEYGVLLSIVCAVALFGFLSGVGVGLGMAAAVFVIKYSRIPVIRQDADAATFSSARRRSVPDRHILAANAESIRVLKISGYLFFGSASDLGAAVAAHLAAPDDRRPRHIIIDFSDTDGFDSSAVNSFVRTAQRMTAAGCQAVFAAAPAALAEQLERAAPLEFGRIRLLPDLDRALELCEDAVLAREVERLDQARDAEAHGELFDRSVDDMLRQLERAERFEAVLEGLAGLVEERNAEAGAVLLRKGQATGGLLLLVSGHAEETRGSAEAPVRLRSLGPGDMAGHAGADVQAASPTDVTAVAPVRYAFLSTEALARLRAERPETALAFLALYAELLEARLDDALQG